MGARTRTGLAGAFLVLLTNAATAGPIQWTYQTFFGGETGRQYLDMGGEVRRLPNYSGQGSPWEWYPYVGKLEQPLTTSGRFEGSGYVGVGYVPSNGVTLLYPDPNAPGFASDRQFKAGLTITDTASGESGTVWLTGTGWDQKLDQKLDEDTLYLGGNRYHIWFNAYNYQYTPGGSVSASVTVTNPEPGSLALAGLGLASAFGFRLRRRFAAR